MHFEIPNYILIKQLGQGTMAEVWLAEHKINKRRAAIKVMKPSSLSDSDVEELFIREGEVLASFRDDNIVAIYDNNRIGDLAYIVMEFLSEGTLQERMQRGPINAGEAIGLTVQIAKALGAAHQIDVIHRDLKPANIMLRNETTPVLTDFGAARMLARTTIYGKDGSIVGTPTYMSPEQITGQPLNGSSDLYALGILFYELLTGALPYPGGSINEIASQHLFAQIPKLPVEIAMLQPILERLLAKKVEERFASAQDFIDALRNCYIHELALRRQVGFAATSVAWSSQLRALGFVLDTQQKTEVRVAQGEFLKGMENTPNDSKVPAKPWWSRRSGWIIAVSALALSIGLFMIWPEPSKTSVAKKVEKTSTLAPRTNQYNYQGRLITLAPDMIFDLTDKVESANVTGLSSNDPNLGISLVLKTSQKLALQQFSEQNVSKEVGLIYKGRLVSVAVLQGPITEGNIFISSGASSTTEEMMTLATELSAN